MYGKELHKNELVEFQYKNFFDVILGWDGFGKGKYIDDIDLCIFYKKNQEKLVVFILVCIIKKKMRKAR